MLAPAGDRNLLFAILGMRMQVLPHQSLIDLLSDWPDNQPMTLGEALEARNELDPNDRALVERVMDRHLAAHRGDVAASLAALQQPASQLEWEHEQLAPSRIRKAWQNAGRGQGRWSTAQERFRPVRLLEREGLGEVWVAHDEELAREVCLKRLATNLLSDRGAQERFQREAEVVVMLEHPTVRPIFARGKEADGRPFYAMRHIHGNRLDESVARLHQEGGRGGMFSSDSPDDFFRELLRRFIAVCHGIAYAHTRGVLHRDLRPENVILGKYGETVIADWSLAKLLDLSTSAPQDRQREASLCLRHGLEPLHDAAPEATAYVSPEIAAQDMDAVGPATDVYSLGAILYHLLTGHAPFVAVDGEDLLRRVQEGNLVAPRRAKPGVPAALEAVCRRAMALRPENRYRTAKELGDDLERWLAHEPVRAHQDPAPVRVRRWLKRHPEAMLGGAATFVAALGATVYGWEASRRELLESRNQQAAFAVQADRRVQGYAAALDAVDALGELALAPAKATPDAAAARSRTVAGDFVRRGDDHPALRRALAQAKLRLALLDADPAQPDATIGRLKEAFEAWIAVRVDQPDSPEAAAGLAATHQGLGRAQRAAGHWPEALTAFETALPLRRQLGGDPAAPYARRLEFAEAMQDLASAQVAAGRGAEAAPQLAAAAAQFAALAAERPNDPAVQELHADALLAQASLEKSPSATLKAAYERIEAARVRRPERIELLAKQADLALRLANAANAANPQQWRRSARTLHAELAARQPNNADAALAAGRLELAAGHDERQRGRLPEAQKAYAEARRMLQRGRTLRLQDAAFAEPLADAWLNDGIALNELDLPSDAARETAALLAALGDLERQLPVGRTALETRGLAEYHCGYALGRLGQWRQSDPHWQNSLAAWRALGEGPHAKPDDPLRLARVERTYAAAKQAQGETKTALPTLTVALQRVLPLSGGKAQVGIDAKQLLGELHLDRARLCEAAADFDAALADWRAADTLLGPNNGPARCGAAACLAKLDRADEALALAEQLAAAKAPAENVYAAALVQAALAKGPAAERRGAAAVALLRRLRSEGFVRDPERRDQLRDDAALAPLRTRPDFQKLEADVKIDAGNSTRTT